MAGVKHKEFGLIWFTSICIIFLRKKSPVSSRIHPVIVYTASFILLYAALTVSMPTILNTKSLIYYTVYNKSCYVLDPVFGCICTGNYISAGGYCRYFESFSLDVALEVLFGLGFVLLGHAIWKLYNHVEYVENERSKEQTKILATEELTKNESAIFDENVVLKKRLRSRTSSLTRPLARAVELIHSLKNSCKIDRETFSDIEYSIYLLKSNNPFDLQPIGPNSIVDPSTWPEGITDLDLGVIGSLFNQEASDLSCSLQKKLLHPSKEVDEVIQAYYSSLQNWNFEIFSFATDTKLRPLYFMGMELFRFHNFEAVLGIPSAKMARFLMKVESSYRKSNSYHNSTHAADVMHAMNFFVTNLGMGSLIEPEEIFAALVAASVHDIDHPGYNNNFLVATKAPIALRYNELAVLENYHCAKAFEIMKQLDCEILEHLDSDQYQTVRNTIICMVLATNVSGHFEYMTRFKNQFHRTGMELDDPASRQLMLEMAMKCADLSNVCKKTSLSIHWTALITNEFFLQGDEEKRLGLPCSPLTDRDTVSVSKSQMGFIDIIVVPMFELWAKFWGDRVSKFPAIENLHANRLYWKVVDDNTH